MKKCKGKFDFCDSWELFSNGRVHVDDKFKGLGFLTMTDMETDKKTRSLPFLGFGNKKGEKVCIEYCPFCGANYRKLGRL